MEHVTVTDDMQDRILSNVDQRFSSGKKRRKPQQWIPAAGLAAAAVILCSVGLRFHFSPITDSETPTVSDFVQGVYPAQEYRSATELAAAVGFSIPELSSVPFSVTQTIYTATDDHLAEVQYTGNADSETLILRKSEGTGDISGDYTQYEQTSTIEINGISVTEKGNGRLISLAYWTDGTYACSIALSSGCSSAQMEQMISEVMGNK